MTDHGFGTGKLTGKVELVSNKAKKKTVAKCISKIKEVVWCHVVHKSTMGADPGDLLWEAEGVDSAELKAKIEKCATKYGYGITFGPTTTFEDESFQNDQPGKHPKAKKR
jgi:hypothetical protein